MLWTLAVIMLALWLVGLIVDAGLGVTLVVEDGYQVAPANPSFLDDVDNVVDDVIAKVLALGGNIIFVENGLLAKFESAALILRNPEHISGN